MAAQPRASSTSSKVLSRSTDELFQTQETLPFLAFLMLLTCQSFTKAKPLYSQPFLSAFNVFSHYIFREVTTLKTSPLTLLASCKLPRGCRYKCTFLPAIYFQPVSIASRCHGKTLATRWAQGGQRGRFPAHPLRSERPAARPARGQPSLSQGSAIPAFKENHPVCDGILLFRGESAFG